MRLGNISSAPRVTISASLLLALAAPGGSAAAQGAAPESLEARLRALEARVAALEARGTASPAPIGGPAAVRCSKLSVNGSGIAPGATLTVLVNGTPVGSYDRAASGDLEPQMRAGLNTVTLSFAAPGTPGPFGTQAELRCLPPGVASSRNEILRLQPRPGRLSAEARVDLVRP